MLVYRRLRRACCIGLMSREIKGVRGVGGGDPWKYCVFAAHSIQPIRYLVWCKCRAHELEVSQYAPGDCAARNRAVLFAF